MSFWHSPLPAQLPVDFNNKGVSHQLNISPIFYFSTNPAIFIILYGLLMIPHQSLSFKTKQLIGAPLIAITFFLPLWTTVDGPGQIFLFLGSSIIGTLNAFNHFFMTPLLKGDPITHMSGLEVVVDFMWTFRKFSAQNPKTAAEGLKPVVSKNSFWPWFLRASSSNAVDAVVVEKNKVGKSGEAITDSSNDAARSAFDRRTDRPESSMKTLFFRTVFFRVALDLGAFGLSFWSTNDQTANWFSIEQMMANMFCMLMILYSLSLINYMYMWIWHLWTGYPIKGDDWTLTTHPINPFWSSRNIYKFWDDWHKLFTPSWVAVGLQPTLAFLHWMRARYPNLLGSTDNNKTLWRILFACLPPLGVFFVSGLTHEYIEHVFYPPAKWGDQMWFFMIHGLASVFSKQVLEPRYHRLEKEQQELRKLGKDTMRTKLLFLGEQWLNRGLTFLFVVFTATWFTRESLRYQHQNAGVPMSWSIWLYNRLRNEGVF